MKSSIKEVIEEVWKERSISLVLFMILMILVAYPVAWYIIKKDEFGEWKKRRRKEIESFN